MRLNRHTAPVGTKGYLPPACLADFEGMGNEPFQDFASDPYVLSDSRYWVDAEGNALSIPATIYSTWQEAVQHTIASEFADALDRIEEAQRDLALVAKMMKVVKP